MVNTQRKEEHWQEYHGGRSVARMNPGRDGRREARGREGRSAGRSGRPEERVAQESRTPQERERREAQACERRPGERNGRPEDRAVQESRAPQERERREAQGRERRPAGRSGRPEERVVQESRMSQEKTRREAQGRERRHGLEERVTQESRMPQERARREIRGREGSLQPELRIEGWETGRPRQTGEPVYRDSFRDSSRRKQPGPRRRTGTTTPGYSREMRSKTVVSKKRKKRKQKKGSFFGKCVKLLTVIAGSVLLLSLAFKIIEDNPWLHRKPGKEKTGDMEQAATMPQKSGAILDPEVEESLKRLTEEDDRAREILENTGNYPEQLLESLSNNPELLEFVLDYPEKKDTSPADTIGDVKKGTVPLLLQWDERWGYGEYGGGLLACTGCGPTCLSMVIAGLTGDDSITPYTVARYAQENGYYEAGAGTKWSLMTEGAARFGIQGREISPDESTVTGELDAGHPIICSMGPGDFTKVGHFIVLTGRKDGKIQVNDPNSRIRSEKLWEFDDLKRQMRNLWAFE